MSLELSNVFNSAWKPYLAMQLARAEVETRLGKMCENFLEGRKVKSGNVEADMPKGCLQGSSLGPTLWNVLMEG